MGKTSFRVHTAVLRAAGRGLAALCVLRNAAGAIHVQPMHAPTTWARLLLHVYTGRPPRWPIPFEAALELGVLASRLGVTTLASHVTAHVARASVGRIGQLSHAAVRSGDRRLVHAVAEYVLRRLHVVRRAPAWDAIATCLPVMAILRRRAPHVLGDSKRRGGYKQPALDH